MGNGNHRAPLPQVLAHHVAHSDLWVDAHGVGLPEMQLQEEGGVMDNLGRDLAVAILLFAALTGMIGCGVGLVLAWVF